MLLDMVVHLIMCEKDNLILIQVTNFVFSQFSAFLGISVNNDFELFVVAFSQRGRDIFPESWDFFGLRFGAQRAYIDILTPSNFVDEVIRIT